MQMNYRRRPAAVAIAAALFALPLSASAQNWMIGARALYVSPNASSSIGGLDVDAAWWAEVDFTYFFTKIIAVEPADRRESLIVGGEQFVDCRAVALATA